MRICRFGDDRLGLVVDGLVHDISALQTEIRAASPYTMKGDAVIKALPEWRDRFLAEAAKVPGIPLSSVELSRRSRGLPRSWRRRPTTPRILPKWRRRQASGSKHTAKIGKRRNFPQIQFGYRWTIGGSPIRFPERRTDHELELVIVIGKQGSDIVLRMRSITSPAIAWASTWSFADLRTGSFRKSCDGYAVLGPWMVTADEIPDPDDVPLLLKVNGEVRQKTNRRMLVYGVRRLIEFASSFYTLYPGESFIRARLKASARSNRKTSLRWKVL